MGNDHWFDDFPTLVVPIASIENLPTLVLPATNVVHKSSPSLYFGMMDGLSLDEQPTWIIPAIQVSRKAAKLEARVSGGEGYVSLIRNLVKSSGIYALSTLASPLVSLVLAPFLTRYLSRSDYGALAILNTIVALAAGVTQLGLSAAFFRAYTYDYESQRDRLGVLSTVVMLLLLISIPLVIVAIVTAPSLATILLNSSALGDSVRVAALVVLAQNLTVPGLYWLRAENRAALFSILSLLDLLVTASANIVLVGGLHMGIVGSLVATGGGYALVVVCTLPIILLRAGIRLRYDMAWGLLAFGLPNVVNLVSGWVLQLSDRYLLGHLGSLSQAASYAVAYSLGGVLSSVIITPFSLAWWSLIFSFAKRDDAPRIFQLVFRWFSIVLLFAAFALSLFGVSVLDIFFPPAYHSSAPVIPIIALSIMFSGVYNVLVIGVSIQRKTWLAAILVMFSALLNVGLNIALIPSYGAMGAAVATLIAYGVLALIGYGVNQRIYPVPFEVGLFIIALFVGIALYAGSDLLAQTQEIGVAWGIRIGSLILYGICLLSLVRLLDSQKRFYYDENRVT